MNMKKKKNRTWKTIFILDAPGISGAGSNSIAKLAAYIEGGGQILHPVRVRSSKPVQA